MSIAINNNNGIIEVSQNGAVPRSYFRCGGNSKAIGSDYIQISIDKDTYNVLWFDLNISGYTPESQYAALYMLAQIFANVPVNPPAPLPPKLKINPDTSTRFDIPAYTGGTDSDFTIEWLQYMHSDTSFPRIYSIGQYPAQNAISIEGDTLYLWLNGGIVSSESMPIDYLNKWYHMVVTRSADTILVWATDSSNNSTQMINATYSNAIPTNGLDFYIGSENADGTYYNGLINNFRWSKDLAVYGTSSPTYPTAPFNVGTAILLIGQGTDLATQLIDQSSTCTITASNITYNSNSGISGYNGSLKFGTI